MGNRIEKTNDTVEQRRWLTLVRPRRRVPSHFGSDIVVLDREREDDLYYREELPGAETAIVYTRTAPPESRRPAGRITSADLEPLLGSDATVYICGSSSFADAVTDVVTSLQVPVDRIRIERFGPSG